MKHKTWTSHFFMQNRTWIFTTWENVFAVTSTPAALNDTKFAPHGNAGNGAPVFLSEEGEIRCGGPIVFSLDMLEIRKKTMVAKFLGLEPGG